MVKKVVGYIALLFLFAGCKKGHQLDCIKGTGDVVTEERQLEPFNKLEITAWLETELIDTNFFRVDITAGEKLMSGIVTEVVDGKLYIRDENRCNWVRDYSAERKIKIYGSPEYIWQHGDGTFTCKNYKEDTLFFYLVGGDSDLKLNSKFFAAQMYATGDLTLDGSVEEMDLTLTAYGSFYGYDCNIWKASINSSGEGDAYTNVYNRLGVNIFSEGNVYYQLEPDSIELNDLGNGELIKQ